MPKYQITHRPKDKDGNPLPMVPLTFTCTEQELRHSNWDEHNRPYAAYDGSVWYHVGEDEIEEIF